jgi:hypothetical protein
VERIGTLPPHIARFLTGNVSKLWWTISVLVFSVAYLVVMSPGATKLFNKIGMDYAILAPQDSYLVD